MIQPDQTARQNNSLGKSLTCLGIKPCKINGEVVRMTVAVSKSVMARIRRKTLYDFFSKTLFLANRIQTKEFPQNAKLAIIIKATLVVSIFSSNAMSSFDTFVTESYLLLSFLLYWRLLESSGQTQLTAYH